MFTCPTPDVVALQIGSITQRPNCEEHICHSQTCKIRHLPVEIHSYNQKFYIVCKFIKPIPGLHPKNTLHTKLNSIFCCQDTGNIHYCHANCTGEKILCESIETCCITGMQFSSEQVRTYGIANRVQTSMTADKSDPLKYSRDIEENIPVALTNSSITTYFNQKNKELSYILMGRDSNDELKVVVRSVGEFDRKEDTPTIALENGDVAVGDLNNDGFNDFLYTGEDSNGSSITKLFFTKYKTP